MPSYCVAPFIISAYTRPSFNQFALYIPDNANQPSLHLNTRTYFGCRSLSYIPPYPNQQMGQNRTIHRSQRPGNLEGLWERGIWPITRPTARQIQRSKYQSIWCRLGDLPISIYRTQHGLPNKATNRQSKTHQTITIKLEFPNRGNQRSQSWSQHRQKYPSQSTSPTINKRKKSNKTTPQKTRRARSIHPLPKDKVITTIFYNTCTQKMP